MKRKDMARTLLDGAGMTKMFSAAAMFRGKRSGMLGEVSCRLQSFIARNLQGGVFVLM